MSKFCKNCGTEVEDNIKYCPKCGASQEEPSQKNTFNIPKREIALAIIFSIITCGIYGIYWYIVMTDDSNNLSQENQTTGVMSLIFTIITCGIYSYYWNYKMGKKMYEAGIKYSKPISDNSLIYLLLSIFGLSIISWCLIQSDLNKFANE